MKNMADYFQEIYDCYKEYMENNSKYSPIVTKKPQINPSKFPTIEIVEQDNKSYLSTLNNEYKYDSLIYDINIYTIDEEDEDGNIIPSYEIAQKLKLLTNNFFNNKLKMRRIICSPIPNLDTNVYRVYMSFTCTVDIQRNIIIRR